jgi:DNA-binding transcriptional regulator YiaG
MRRNISVSVDSELKARLERLGPVRVVSPPRLSSDEQVVLLLRRTGALYQAVTAVRRLVAAQAGLRAAHLAITRLAAEGWAVCTVSRKEDIEALASDLAAMNIQVRRRVPAAEAVPDIAAERARHGLSQREFADLLSVDVRTLQNWEQGRNRPDPAALSLMRVFARAPEIVEEALSEPVA